MAVVRARSSPPYGLFAVVFVAVLMAGWAILATVLWSQEMSDRETAQSSLQRVASDVDMRNIYPGLVSPTDPRGTTALQKAQAQINGMREIIAGANATTNADALKEDADIKAALEKYRSLKAAVGGLTGERNELNDSLRTAVAAAKQAGDSNAAAQKQLLDATNGYQQSIAQLTSQIAKLQQDLAGANQSRDQAVASGEDKLTKQQQGEEERRRELVLALEQTKGELDKAEAEVKDLRIRLQIASGGGPKVDVGEPDGRILRVNAAAGEVYIDLARKDGIREGMTFTCYDPRLGVRYDTEEAAAGNGMIEVRSVGENLAVCRITHTTPGHTIQVNDLISNLVYHNNKSRKFRFVVSGDFDLDGDGVATAAERDRLIAMIIGWGGQVDSEVTSQTDYLVFGERPSSPTIIESQPEGAASATAPGSVADERSKRQKGYDDLIEAARRLSIPALNANRFLNMIGYYNTTIVRY